MLKLKKIEEILEKEHRDSCWRDEDSNQRLYVLSCAVGNNYYEYGESCPGKYDWSLHPELKNDPRIILVNCANCCHCGSW